MEIREILEKLYEYRDDETQFEIERAKFSKEIKSLGISKSDFKNIWLAFVREKTPPERIIYKNTEIEAPKGYASLYTNSWETDGRAIYRMTEFGRVEASCHPILPVERLTNIDTGMQKLKVAFKSNSHWQEVVADRSVFTSVNSIMQLSNNGVRMSQDTARDLVKYLYEIERDNDSIIPYKQSIERMGWIEGHGFVPYHTDLVFDGHSKFKNDYESLCTSGSEKKWIEYMKTARQRNVIALKIVMAASFASPMLKPMMKVPFVVHMFGTSEYGKTVGMIAAASIWGNPNEGHLFKTFNGTVVSTEINASFYNSIPIFMDELQINKDDKNFSPDKAIYAFCESSGKQRSNKNLGLNRTPSWKNCMISNGENAIIKENSGAGAANRTIEIECHEHFFENLPEAADFFRTNYGHIGKKWTKWLMDENNIKACNETYNKVYAKLCATSTTRKQAMAAAMIITADYHATQVFFGDAKNITMQEMMEFLKTKQSVSTEARATEYLYDWVAMNQIKFTPHDKECWGKVEGGVDDPDFVYIVGSKFKEVIEKQGYPVKPLLSYLRKQGKIETPTDGLMVSARIGTNTVRCVKLRLKDPMEGFEPVEIEELPFK